MKSIFKMIMPGLLFLSSFGLGAQTISGGFKTGLNFSRIDGDLIEDANGNKLESFSYATGFHVGAIINVKFTDYFGLRGELLYSQKGTDYDYNGGSYIRLYNADGSREIVNTATRNTTINVSNSHLDIPIMAYLRFGRIEIAGGVNAALLLGSRGSGEVALREVRGPFGQALDDIVMTLDANYFRDEYQITDFVDPDQVLIQNTQYVVPSTIGAYYDANDSSENLYRRLDLGLNAQVGFYLNQGLFLSFRLNYGLSDITNQAQDVDYQALDNNDQVILRDDFDRNISLQASIGFSF